MLLASCGHGCDGPGGQGENGDSDRRTRGEPRASCSHASRRWSSPTPCHSWSRLWPSRTGSAAAEPSRAATSRRRSSPAPTTDRTGTSSKRARVHRRSRSSRSPGTRDCARPRHSGSTQRRSSVCGSRCSSLEWRRSGVPRLVGRPLTARLRHRPAALALQRVPRDRFDPLPLLALLEAALLGGLVIRRSPHRVSPLVLAVATVPLGFVAGNPAQGGSSRLRSRVRGRRGQRFTAERRPPRLGRLFAIATPLALSSTSGGSCRTCRRLSGRSSTSGSQLPGIDKWAWTHARGSLESGQSR